MDQLLPWIALFLFGCATTALVWAVATTLLESSSVAAATYENDISNKLEAMFLFVPAQRLVDIGWMAAATVFMLVMLPFSQIDPPWLPLVGLVVATSAGYAVFRLPNTIVTHLKRRRTEQFNLQLLEALPMMSNALRAGFSILQAFESVAEGMDGPMRQEVTLFLQQTRVGVSFTDALQEFDKRVGSEDLTLICTSIEIARRAGGNLTEIFDTIAATIRARLRIHQHIRTLTAQGRMQGYVIGAMPFLLGTGMAIFKPDVMMPFIFSLVGFSLILLTVLLVVLGGLIIRKIITIDV